ncbi:MAG: Trk system potassium transporter TrkA [Treponema sp.]|jgi:trk system potassium uptake protein TrkA|nr:Trk system potassium transporter TrkA [Treponema sp.]
MHIIIVGAGLVGTQLAQHLIREKHDVSLIEANEERARHASNRLDCLVIHDEGNSIHALEEAGAAKADALVCVTDSDEINMIICGLAAFRYPRLLKIARVRNEDYVQLIPPGRGPQERAAGAQILGVDYFVHPDVEASRSVLNAIEHGAMGDILSFANTPYELGSVDITGGSAFDGLALKDFRSLVEGESLVTLLERKGESILPGGATVLARGDRIHILAKEQEMDRVLKLAGRTERPLRKIGIVGGGRLGVLIAEGLLEREEARGFSFFTFIKTLMPRNSRRVIIIERDYNLCKELAARFPDALILNEDISDESFVAEERLDDLDLIITTTNQQELNIITAVYLKFRGVDRTIALVTGSGYAAIARQLGVDVVIPMKSVVVDSIISRLMGSGVRGVHRLGDGNIGIIEIEIGPQSAVVDTPLREFRLSAGGLVMLVNRGETSFIPQGDYVFTQGDHIVLITKNGNEPEIERLFGISR